MLNINLPNPVSYILQKIEDGGHRADIVGGPVRDFLLGKTPSDYDITTSATPDEIKAIFSGERIIETGIKHGTVTLVLGGENYEITTYRVDGEYKDCRHPESISFATSIEEDLSRRDFTANAIAYSDLHGITDLFGGKEDIEQRTLRAVGDPYLRFSEDALRILRGVRFSSVLGFDIESKTAEAAIAERELLLNVSSERIYSEWKKLIAGQNAYPVLQKYSDIISVFLPEIKNMILPERDHFDAAEPLVRTLSIFALSCGIGAARSFKTAMERLRSESSVRDLGTLALTNLSRYKTDTPLGQNLLLMDFGPDCARLTVECEVALGIRDREAIALLDKLLSERAPYRTADLDINGNDMIAIGYRGSEIGKAMRKLLLAVIRSEIKNERGALISRAEELYRE